MEKDMKRYLHFYDPQIVKQNQTSPKLYHITTSPHMDIQIGGNPRKTPKKKK